MSIQEIMPPNGTLYLYVFPIAVSLLTGVLVWLFCTFIPEKRKKESLKLEINSEYFDLNNQIFNYFEILLRNDRYAPSSFQPQIRTTTLSQEDIELCLYNKKLSISDSNLPYFDRMIGCGEDIIAQTEKINAAIMSIHLFSYFITPEEIRLLKNIKTNVNHYIEYFKNNFFKVPNLSNPSLSFMSKNVYELQIQLRLLNEILYKRNTKDRDFILSKLLYLFYSKEYKKCISLGENWKEGSPGKSESDSTFTIATTAACMYQLGKKKKSYKYLELFLEKSADIVGYRALLRCFIVSDDTAAKDIILKYCGLEKLELVQKIIADEDAKLKSEVDVLTTIKRHYEKDEMHL